MKEGNKCKINKTKKTYICTPPSIPYGNYDQNKNDEHE
jgi:hypothetical protein